MYFTTSIFYVVHLEFLIVKEMEMTERRSCRIGGCFNETSSLLLRPPPGYPKTNILPALSLRLQGSWAL
ncbi:hypothetical protein Nepgr_019993 [Nepenthes gracilis]|uniref:Uncharacterized protein n=1 Tax=Nepenthes gracilis TaxID=150966 RepID=A0AAD3SX61_NEPGR|nr:hypothetical protein Nepgr_019993 [Nepenthes gracilis]